MQDWWKRLNPVALEKTCRTLHDEEVLCCPEMDEVLQYVLTESATFGEKEEWLLEPDLLVTMHCILRAIEQQDLELNTTIS